LDRSFTLPGNKKSRRLLWEPFDEVVMELSYIA
jgi:hypothetical protein